MLRGYRGIVFAAGLILAGATGPPQTNRGQPAQASSDKIERALEDMATSLREANKASDLDQPCEEGDNKRSSDLCAQWKAADAAWLFGALGTLVGALTLAAACAAAYFAKKAADHTETGAKAAQDAVNEAQRIGEAQVRCYLTFRDAEITLDDEGVDFATCTIGNSGQSPALKVDWRGMVHTAMNNRGRAGEVFKGSMFESIETIGAQDTHGFIPAPVDFDFTDEELAHLADPTDEIGIAIVVNMFATFEDVFGRSDSIRQNYVTVINDLPRKGEVLKMRPLGRTLASGADYTPNDDTRHRI